MSVGEPLSLGKPAAPSQQSLLALSWLNFFLAGMQTPSDPLPPPISRPGSGLPRHR